MSTTSFSTPKKQKPNPHPYAIKTTSTGLLSRNSSSSSTASGSHHYIPPSPSPSPKQTAFGGERTYITRHRYSTSESPRPLPPPPSATALLGNDDDDDDTPRRMTRAQRAYSLPQEIKLPEDPKRWSPAEVSIYLTSSLNTAAGSGGRDIPTPVAHDIATFVKDKKISGRRFLRLNEVDLEEYGINQLWRTTLVDASRALRRNVLRGSIWGNPSEHDKKRDDYDDNNLSSNSSYVITNRKRSISTTSESRGRVRDMIDTLERSSSASSSEQDEEGTKDTSSKRDKGLHHHRHRSLEQQRQQLLQQQGRLPQRGSVSTLFGSSAPGSEGDFEDEDSTITAHTRRNASGNEPRLLPFPPTGPKGTSNNHYAHIVSPSHTGTSHSLPPSPLDHAQNQQTAPYHHALNTQPLHHQPFIFPSHSQHNPTPITLDYYELGFKNSFPPSPPIRSPNSQRYVVQHNNVQPSSSTPGAGVGGHSTGGSSKGSRLLPYPPIVGEAELFHPRPRMGVGVGGLASGLLEDGLDEDVEGGDESTYHSALDIQTDIADSEYGGDEESTDATSEETPGTGNEIETSIGSDATDGVEHPEKAKEEEEEELIVQDLLLDQSHTRSRVISGVEAWEMELGDTVNQINSDGSGPAAFATGSISSIGGTKTRTRPKKRELMGEIGRKSGKMLEVDGLTMTGVLGSEAPNSVAEGDTVDDNASVPFPDSSAFATTSPSRQSALDERESTLAILESSLNVRESAIVERDAFITKRESSIADRESCLDIRESSIASRESTISKLESGLTSRESALTTYESEIQRRAGDVQQREMEVEKRVCEVERREREVSEREMRVERREMEVKEWYQKKLSEIDERVLVVDVPPAPTTTTMTITPGSSSAPVASSTCTCSAAKLRWPPSPMEFARRLCATLLIPVLGEERTSVILLRGNRAADSSSTSSSTTTTSATTTTSFPTLFSLPIWSLKRDVFLNRLMGAANAGEGSFLALVGIGICVIFLRGVARRVLRVGGFGRR